MALRAPITSVFNADQALEALRKKRFDVLFLDIQMRDPKEGLRYLPKLIEAGGGTEIIVCSGLTDYQTVKEAMKLGASDYIAKDFEPEEIIILVARIKKTKALKKNLEQKNFEVLQDKHPFLGNAPSVTKIKNLLEKYQKGKGNVLITGQTGSGKEVFARQLRGHGENGVPQPFVSIDSSTIQGSMAESILFGHEKGAFTGADQKRRGIFEEADGGIIYFDEIGNMPVEIQSKLLRVLQEKEVKRLGSNQSIPLEFRVVAATNKNLESLIQQGKFLDDLYQRIAVLPVEIPPLRERKEDIPLLWEHFAKSYALEHQIILSEDVLAILLDYRWPGNIRELSNLVSYLSTICEHPQVTADDLPEKILYFSGTSPAKASGNYFEKLHDFEKRMFTEEFANHQGNVAKMAESLGIGTSTLYAKLKAYQILKK